ncbi:hypothetical protein F4811DRAFT_524521 [Daldinia bambusicola]|nr:hypothetical protein F4811DRAFT_524521 [Daldinia bambusicola]
MKNMATLDVDMRSHEVSVSEKQGVSCTSEHTRAAAYLNNLADISQRPSDSQPQDVHSLGLTVRRNAGNQIHDTPISLGSHGVVRPLPPTSILSFPNSIPTLASSLSDNGSKTTEKDLEEDDGTAWDVGSTGQGVSRPRVSVDEKGYTHPKRRRDTNDQNPDSDEGNLPASKRALPRPEFACPFYKYDAVRHLRCHNYELHRIGDVRQHILRRHASLHHCPRCSQTFHLEGELQDHIRHGSCQAGESQPPRELISGRFRELKNPASILRNDVEKWYSIWDLIFPDIPRPASPYFNRRVEVPMEMLQDHMVASLPRILNERLKSIMSIPLDAQERIIAVFSGTIVEYFNQFDDALQTSPIYATAEEIKRDINKRVASDVPVLYGSSPDDKYRRSIAGRQLRITTNSQPNETIPSTFPNILLDRIFDAETQQADISTQATSSSGPSSIPGTLCPTSNATHQVLTDVPNQEHQHSDTPSKVSTSAQGRKPASSRLWEIYEQQIHQIYIDENRTLPELMSIMEEKHGFHAS